MKPTPSLLNAFCAITIAFAGSQALAQDQEQPQPQPQQIPGRYPDVQAIAKTARIEAANRAPYRILDIHQTLGKGSIDYVTADSNRRRLYVPRGKEIQVFSLDSYNLIGVISNTVAHGVAIDPSDEHGFSSSSPVVMWDTTNLQVITNIEVKGKPDGIFYEPRSRRVFVFSHTAPNATVIDARNGTVIGTMDLGGKPEQAVSDNEGHIYVALEDKAQVAMVDVNTLTVTDSYNVSGANTPSGLAIDPNKHLLFVMCRNPALCVIISTADGRTITSVPIGEGSDGGGFNPQTLQAFSSQRDGTLTIINERGSSEFDVAQNLETRPGAKTCAFDARTGHIILIATERPPASAATDGAQQGDGEPASMLDIIVAGL